MERRKPCQSQRCIRDVNRLCGGSLGESGAHRSFLCKLGTDLPVPVSAGLCEAVRLVVRQGKE